MQFANLRQFAQLFALFCFLEAVCAGWSAAPRPAQSSSKKQTLKFSVHDGQHQNRGNHDKQRLGAGCEYELVPERGCASE
jgi:hypothetical protein